MQANEDWISIMENPNNNRVRNKNRTMKAYITVKYDLHDPNPYTKDIA